MLRALPPDTPRPPQFQPELPTNHFLWKTRFFQLRPSVATLPSHTHVASWSHVYSNAEANKLGKQTQMQLLLGAVPEGLLRGLANTAAMNYKLQDERASLIKTFNTPSSYTQDSGPSPSRMRAAFSTGLLLVNLGLWISIFSDFRFSRFFIFGKYVRKTCW